MAEPKRQKQDFLTQGEARLQDLSQRQESLAEVVSQHTAILGDHAGQLKTVPTVASALQGTAGSLQSAFNGWVAAVLGIGALIIAAVAVVVTYQVRDSQKLAEQQESLAGLERSYGELQRDVASVSGNVALLVDRQARAGDGEAEATPKK